MDILLTGGSGLLGQELIAASATFNDIKIWAPTRQELDITKSFSIIDYMRNKIFSAVIHAAALTGLERCENDKRLALITNVEGTLRMAKICHSMQTTMFYISTDYVFDGEKGNYDEEDIPNPIGYYAKTKWAGEVAALSYDHRVIRTSFCKIIWPHPKAFSDKWSTFDTVDIIASLILSCVKRKHSWDHKILHIGTTRKTFIDMARKSKPNIEGISVKDMHVYVPLDTSLNTARMRKVLNS